MEHVDHDDPVRLAIIEWDHVVVRLAQTQPVGELGCDLLAEQLCELRKRLDGEHLPLRDCGGDGHRVDAGAGAVVDDGLGAAQTQQTDDSGLRQRLEPGGILQPLPVLWIEGVGHQASMVVMSNSGG